MHPHRLTVCASSLALALALAACGASPSRPAPAPATSPAGTPAATRSTEATPCLSIAAWNDMHGQLEAEDVQVDATRVPAGGVVAMADQLALLRASGDAVVVLDAGDLFTGPLGSTLAEGAPIIDAYDAMGVDAAAIGNHEFDFGPVGYARVTAPPGTGDDAGADGPRGALLARMSAARFPFLAANLHRSDARPLGWPNERASTRIARGGFDVGVVGYTTVDTPLTTLKPNVVGLDFATGAAATVASEIRALRAAGASPIVLLAHASLEGELPQRLDDPADPRGDRREGEMATLLDAIPEADRPDVIVAGHRHQWMLGRVRGVPIVSSDQHGVGLARIRFCRAAGDTRPPALAGIERRVAMASEPPASELGARVAAVIAPWQAKVKAEADAIVADLPKPCAAHALNGTALGEQTARAVAEHAVAEGKPPPGARVVGLVNSGGIRTSLRAGPLRYRDLFATSPFENGVSVCVTTRQGLVRTVANALRSKEAHERLPFGIAGAHLTLSRSEDGSMAVKRVVLEGDARAPAPRDGDVVWLAIPDFVLWGGDALLEGVTCTASTTSQLRVRDAWRAVIAREQRCDGPSRNVTVETP